jgi:hypothetical protein
MNGKLLKITFIIAVGFSQRITNKTYEALAKIQRMSVSFLLESVNF